MSFLLYLIKLNLSTLTNSSNLRSLLLEGNPFKEIDLTPLRSLEKLGSFSINAEASLFWMKFKPLKERLPEGLQPFYQRIVHVI